MSFPFLPSFFLLPYKICQEVGEGKVNPRLNVAMTELGPNDTGIQTSRDGPFRDLQCHQVIKGRLGTGGGVGYRLGKKGVMGL